MDTGEQTVLAILDEHPPHRTGIALDDVAAIYCDAPSVGETQRWYCVDHASKAYAVSAADALMVRRKYAENTDSPMYTIIPGLLWSTRPYVVAFTKRPILTQSTGLDYAANLVLAHTPAVDIDWDLTMFEAYRRAVPEHPVAGQMFSAYRGAPIVVNMLVTCAEFLLPGHTEFGIDRLEDVADNDAEVHLSSQGAVDTADDFIRKNSEHSCINESDGTPHVLNTGHSGVFTYTSTDDGVFGAFRVDAVIAVIVHGVDAGAAAKCDVVVAVPGYGAGTVHRGIYLTRLRDYGAVKLHDYVNHEARPLNFFDELIELVPGILWTKETRIISAAATPIGDDRYRVDMRLAGDKVLDPGALTTVDIGILTLHQARMLLSRVG